MIMCCVALRPLSERRAASVHRSALTLRGPPPKTEVKSVSISSAA